MPIFIDANGKRANVDFNQFTPESFNYFKSSGLLSSVVSIDGKKAIVDPSKFEPSTLQHLQGKQVEDINPAYGYNSRVHDEQLGYNLDAISSGSKNAQEEDANLFDFSGGAKQAASQFGKGVMHRADEMTQQATSRWADIYNAEGAIDTTKAILKPAGQEIAKGAYAAGKSVLDIADSVVYLGGYASEKHKVRAHEYAGKRLAEREQAYQKFAESMGGHNVASGMFEFIPDAILFAMTAGTIGTLIPVLKAGGKKTLVKDIVKYVAKEMGEDAATKTVPKEMVKMIGDHYKEVGLKEIVKTTGRETLAGGIAGALETPQQPLVGAATGAVMGGAFGAITEGLGFGYKALRPLSDPILRDLHAISMNDDVARIIRDTKAITGSSDEAMVAMILAAKNQMTPEAFTSHVKRIKIFDDIVEELPKPMLLLDDPEIMVIRKEIDDILADETLTNPEAIDQALKVYNEKLLDAKNRIPYYDRPLANVPEGPSEITAILDDIDTMLGDTPLDKDGLKRVQEAYQQKIDNLQKGLKRESLAAEPPDTKRMKIENQIREMAPDVEIAPGMSIQQLRSALNEMKRVKKIMTLHAPGGGARTEILPDDEIRVILSKDLPADKIVHELFHAFRGGMPKNYQQAIRYWAKANIGDDAIRDGTLTPEAEEIIAQYFDAYLRNPSKRVSGKMQEVFEMLRDRLDPNYNAIKGNMANGELNLLFDKLFSDNRLTDVFKGFQRRSWGRNKNIPEDSWYDNFLGGNERKSYNRYALISNIFSKLEAARRYGGEEGYEQAKRLLGTGERGMTFSDEFLKGFFESGDSMLPMLDDMVDYRTLYKATGRKIMLPDGEVGVPEYISTYLAAKQIRDKVAQGFTKIPQSMRGYKKVIKTYDTLPQDIKEIVDEKEALVRRTADALLNMMEEAGLISASEKAAIKAKNPHWVPLNRVLDVDDAVENTGITGFAEKRYKKNVLRKFEGSARDITDPIENLAENIYTVTKAADRNRFMNNLFGKIQADAKGGRFNLEDVMVKKENIHAKYDVGKMQAKLKKVMKEQQSWRPYESTNRDKKTGKTRKTAADRELDAIDRAEMAAEMESDLYKIMMKPEELGPNDIWFKEVQPDGTVKGVAYEIKDPYLANVLRDSSLSKAITYLANVGGFASFASMKKLQRAGITTAMPFTQKNILRDLVLRTLTDPTRPTNAASTAFWVDNIGFLPRNAVNVINDLIPTFIRIASPQADRVLTNTLNKVPGALRILGGKQSIQELIKIGKFEGALGSSIHVEGEVRNNIRRAINRAAQTDKRWSTFTPMAKAVRAGKWLILDEKLGVQRTWNALKFISTTAEMTPRIMNASRVSLFDVGKIRNPKDYRGMAPAMRNKQRAIGLAYRNATADFGEMGTISQNVGKYVNFFTAAMAGTREEYKAFAQNPVGNGIALFSLGATYLGVKHFLGEDSAKVDPMNRNMFLHTKLKDPTGSGRQIRIAMPYGFVGTWLNSIGAAYDAVVEEDPQAAQQMVMNMLNLFPSDITSYIPPLPAALIGGKVNRQLFFNKPIVSQATEGKAGYLQYTPGTSELSKSVAKGMDVLGVETSPAMLDYYVRSMGGTIASQAMKGIDTITRAATDEQRPTPTMSLLGETTGMGAYAYTPAEELTYSNQINLFYQNIESIGKAKSRVEDKGKNVPERHSKEAKLSSYFSGVSSDMRKNNKKIQEVMNNDKLTSEQKATKIKKLARDRNKLATEANEKHKKAMAK